MKRIRIKNLILTVLLALACTAFIACNEPPAPSHYVVNFVGANGTVISAVMVEAGTSPVYNGETPTKASQNGADYVFVGWELNGVVYEGALPVVKKNTIFTASFREDKQSYVITFDVNGTLTQQTVKHGELPTYTGQTQFTIGGTLYEIAGWETEIVPVTGETTYVAILQIAGVDVTFVVAGESLVQRVQKGTAPKFYGGTPYREEELGFKYVFQGWTDGVNTFAAGAELPAATGDVTYTAIFEKVYREYSVTFVQDGTKLYVDEALYGHAPTYAATTPEKPSSLEYDYNFVGWKRYGVVYEGELPLVYEEAEYEATFEKSPRTFTLTVNYVKAGATVSTYQTALLYGENYRVATPAISGCTAVPYVSGIVTQNTTLTVTYVQELSVWTGASTAWTNGAGTQASPYLIESAAQLAYLAAQVDAGQTYEGAYFRLETNLDLAGIAWNAIGDNAHTFAGTFDGNNHSITGLYYHDEKSNTVANSGHGLFSTVSGHVKNLTVAGDVYSIARYTAIIVGNLTAGSITNCTSYGDLRGYGNNGGVVGLCKGVVSNCVNYATVRDNGVSGAYRFGGVVGTTTADVTNCVNYGTICPEIGGESGGVVGRMEGANTVTGLVNYGVVRATVGNNIGGVIGYDLAGGTRTQLKNYGTVYGQAWSAGIIGSFCNKATYTHCTNYGYVWGESRAAGISGRSGMNEASSEGGSGYLSDCVNYGDIFGLNNCAGGITAVSYAPVSNSTNYGNVTCTGKVVGGVAGEMLITTYSKTLDPELKNCVNYGTITVKNAGSNAETGGVCGRDDWKNDSNGTRHKVSITNCKNYGDVVITGTGMNFTGGVVGANNGGYVTNCHNYATVRAPSGKYVGGVAGSSYGYSQLSKCNNYGAVSGVTVGQIYGQLPNGSYAKNCQSLGKIF